MPKYLLLSFGRTSATLEKPGRLGGRVRDRVFSRESGREASGREGLTTSRGVFSEASTKEANGGYS